MAMADVTVMGAGIFGLSVAWACAGRGARVRLIDPGGPGAGASGGVLGALAPHTPDNWNAKKQFQLDALVRAGEFWRAVDAASGLSSGYGRTGRLQPLVSDKAVALARRREEGARAHWPEGMDWQVIDAGEAPEWSPLSPSGLLVRDSLSARLHPARACASLAAALAARGVEICLYGTPEGRVVWATGTAGLAALSRDLGVTIGAGEKGQAAVLGFDAGEGAAQLFVDGVHIVPHADGTTAIGSTSEGSFDDPEATDAQLDGLIDRARAAVPALADAPVLDRWAGVRPKTVSRAPLLGAWPGRAGTYVANGGYKIGFGIAPEVGRVMAELVLEGNDMVPDAFRPQSLLSRL